MPISNPESRDKIQIPRGLFWRVSGVALAAAIACTVILAIVRHPGISEMFRTFEFALIYSCAIAFPTSLVFVYLEQVPFAIGPRTKLLIRVATLLTMNATGCLLAGVVLVLIGLNQWNAYWTEFRFSVLLGMVITLTAGFGTSFYEQTRARLETAALEIRTRQMEQERAYKLAAEAQLSSLESRIHPHFLFNTLNSIAALIPRDPKRAEDMVGKLASLLRFSLNANQNRLVPLGQELKIVRDYLEIEKARFDSRLRYTIQVPAELESIGVPPLSVEILVENSVKHVIAQRPEGGEISITAQTREGRLELEVRDSGPGFARETIPPGHGLDNLSGRLTLLFGQEAHLEFARNGANAAVRVSFPAKA